MSPKIRLSVQRLSILHYTVQIKAVWQQRVNSLLPSNFEAWQHMVTANCMVPGLATAVPLILPGLSLLQWNHRKLTCTSIQKAQMSINKHKFHVLKEKRVLILYVVEFNEKQVLILYVTGMSLSLTNLSINQELSSSCCELMHQVLPAEQTIRIFPILCPPCHPSNMKHQARDHYLRSFWVHQSENHRRNCQFLHQKTFPGR